MPKAASKPVLHKAYDTTTADDGWLVASTPVVDRDQDRVFPLGVKTANYMQNPVLVFGHQYTEPWSIIGRAADIKADDKGLRILPQLREPVNDQDPMHVIKALWSQGLLRGASIGFRPIKTKSNEYGGKDILEAELLEVSLVPIPANQEALRVVMKSITGSDELDGDTDGETEPDDDAEVEHAASGQPDAPGSTPDAAPDQTDLEPVTDALTPMTDHDDAATMTVEGMTPDQQLRLTAIISDFVSSIRPYLEV